MVVVDQRDVDRKVISILKILSRSSEPIGARAIARELEAYGISLTERAVRYHLQIMDERGLTEQVGREGRLITEQGRREISSALVTDKVGYVISRIKLLAFQTTFDPLTARGDVIMNTTLFRREEFEAALRAMEPSFRAGLSVSSRVAVCQAGGRLGNVIVPEGSVGFSTVCSVTINGVLLKSGVPMDSRFGGILEMQSGRPQRFVELIHYSGSSLDPSEAFIRARMTAVNVAAQTGQGRVLANFRDLPGACRPVVEQVTVQLEAVGIRGPLVIGEISEPVSQVPVELSMCGAILLGGLNPVAAAAEAGIEADYRAMSTPMPFESLREVWTL
jgi:HTH-type transcriptional regulator, global nitrogen regulator NrpRI